MKNITLTFLSLVLLVNCSKTHTSRSIANSAITTTEQIQNASNNLKISANFNSETGTYNPELIQGLSQLPAESSRKKCVSAGYKNNGFDSESMIIDEDLPKLGSRLNDDLSLLIVPDSNGKPVDYKFSAQASDEGCGAENLTAVCAIWNMTANSDIANGKLDASVIPGPFVWAPGQTCMTKTRQLTNNFAEFASHVISNARVNDRLRFEIYLQDGAGNYSRSYVLDFYKYEKLLNGPVLANNY